MAHIRKDRDKEFYQGAIETLAEEFMDPKSEQLIFLGAGASIDRERTGLPGGQHLAAELAKDAKIDWHETILLSRVAFYYESIRSRDALNRKLRERLSCKTPENEAPWPTSATLEQVVELLDHLVSLDKRPWLVVTTNYDELFENAYRNRYRSDPERLIYRGAIDPSDKRRELYRGFTGDDNAFTWRPHQNICLFKLHGCISDAEGQNLVITDEDYINFMSNAASDDRERKHLPLEIEAALMRSTVLFVGYSLEDWNFRLIFKATCEVSNRKKYAIQLLTIPDAEKQSSQARIQQKALVRFWERKNVDIIDVEANLFMSDLLQEIQGQSADRG